MNSLKISKASKEMFLQVVGYLILCIVYTEASVEINIPTSLDVEPSVDFYPEELMGVMENQDVDVLFEINWKNTTVTEKFQSDFSIDIFSEDSGILEVVNSSFPDCIPYNSEPQNFSFTVRGIFLGYTNVKVVLKTAVNRCAIAGLDEYALAPEDSPRNFNMLVSVIRPPSILVNIVTGIFAALVAVNFINMGVQLDIVCIKNVLKKPIGPAIGFACQFVFMPLAAYGISYLLLEDDSLRLGLFTLGCSPGGSMSNFWTLLFDGDVNLSVTMTFISTIAALAMMPLWIVTLGSTLFRGREVTIPYMNMTMSLIGLTLPIAIGLLIQKYSPRLTRFSNKIIKPFTIICVLFGISFASYVNRFVYYLFTWQVVVAGLGIAWGGYCFGALVAWLCRLEKAQIVAISIETAFQNPAVAFVLLLLTLPQPDADLSSVPIVAQLMLTGIPLWLLLIGTRIHAKIKKRRDIRGSTGEIKRPEIDTVDKVYFSVDTNPPEEMDDVTYEAKWKTVDLDRYSSKNQRSFM